MAVQELNRYKWWQRWRLQTALLSPLVGKRLAPGGRGTTVRLTGELKVNVPLLGRKLEQSAAPAVLAGFRTQQRAGDRWLGERQQA